MELVSPDGTTCGNHVSDDSPKPSGRGYVRTGNRITQRRSRGPKNRSGFAERTIKRGGHHTKQDRS